MQYILVDRERVKDRAYHETMPDGRVILPFSEVKMSGVLEDVTIVPSAIALKAMIQEQKDKGVKPPLELPGTVEPGDGETANGDYEDYEEVEDATDTGNNAGTDTGEGLDGGLPEEGETVQGEADGTAGEAGETEEDMDIEEEEEVEL